MKRIVISLAIVAAVAAVVVYGTTAFFSDQETSNNNTFTAGELDLRFQVGGAAAAWADVDGKPLFDGVAFPLYDLKPGDTGEKTVRLWVDDNPSCGKVSVELTSDLDNTCNEPEIGDEPSCATSPTGAEAGSGELNDQVEFMVWLDEGVTDRFQGPQDLSECDNDYQGQFEQALTRGTITSDKSYGIGELPTSQAGAYCYGVAYCFGSFNPDGTCDGSLVKNEAQTDSFKADLIINALQKRNQFVGECPTGDWPAGIPR